MSPDALRHLDAVARHLPFGIDDYAAANAAFARWKASGEDDDLQAVELWTYCYVQRYFLIRFLRERGAPSDFEACLSRAVQRARRSYDRVREAEKFASYVSVTCKNTLRNYRRDRRDLDEIADGMATTRQPDVPDYDGDVLRAVLARALDAMPATVREIGRLRFLDRMEYPEIAEATGRPLPTVRTYAARAMGRLREDPQLRALYYDDVLPPEAAPRAPRGGP